MKKLMIALAVFAALFALAACTPAAAPAPVNEGLPSSEGEVTSTQVEATEAGTELFAPAISSGGAEAPAAESPAQIESVATFGYREFTLPGESPVTFELPEDWDFWGNGGWLSPNNGEVMAGFRQVFGTDDAAAKRLYNEGSNVLEDTTVSIGGQDYRRFTVEVTLTSASTGEVISHTYEMIYVVPTPTPDVLGGVFISAQSVEQLGEYVEVAEHMVQTLRW